MNNEMKRQIELLKALQELILIKGEGGFCSYAGMRGLAKVSEEIGKAESQLEPRVREAWDALVKRNPVVVAVMRGGACGACGMAVPTALGQAIRKGETLCVCPHCGRILYAEPEDALRGFLPKAKGKSASSATLARFSSDELVVPRLKATNDEQAIAELSQLLEKNGLVSDAVGLAAASLRREGMLPTSVEGGLAFPHVRGVEGGQLTFAVGRSERGIAWGERKVNYVFLAAIPSASAAFYLRRVAGIVRAFNDEKKRGWVDATASDRVALWKAILKATRVDTK